MYKASINPQHTPVNKILDGLGDSETRILPYLVINKRLNGHLWEYFMYPIFLNKAHLFKKIRILFIDIGKQKVWKQIIPNPVKMGVYF